MELFDPNGPWLTVVIFTVLFLVIFRPGGPGAGVSGPVVLQRPGRRPEPGGEPVQRPGFGFAGGAGAGAAAVTKEFLRGARRRAPRSRRQSTGVSGCLFGGGPLSKMGMQPDPRRRSRHSRAEKCFLPGTCPCKKRILPCSAGCGRRKSATLPYRARGVERRRWGEPYGAGPEGLFRRMGRCGETARRALPGESIERKGLPPRPRPGPKRPPPSDPGKWTREAESLALQGFASLLSICGSHTAVVVKCQRLPPRGRLRTW